MCSPPYLCSCDHSDLFLSYLHNVAEIACLPAVSCYNSDSIHLSISHWLQESFMFVFQFNFTFTHFHICCNSSSHSCSLMATKSLRPSEPLRLPGSLGVSESKSPGVSEFGSPKTMNCNFTKNASQGCFLAVQNSSLGDLVTRSLTESLRVLLLLTYKERP